MPRDDMNMEAVNCNFLFTKQNVAFFTTGSISLTKACKAALLETLFRFTSV